MTENEATREMTFEEEYQILQKEKEELFAMENCDSEPPFANSVVRRASRCIRKLLEEIQQYRAIGTVKEFKALKEKSEPKKPTEKELPYSEEVGLNSEWHCPACGSYVGYFTEGMNEPEQMEYCNVCGQHIAKDWSE